MIIISFDRWFNDIQPKLIADQEYMHSKQWKLKQSDLPGYLEAEFPADGREELYFRLRFM